MTAALAAGLAITLAVAFASAPASPVTPAVPLLDPHADRCESTRRRSPRSAGFVLRRHAGFFASGRRCRSASVSPLVHFSRGTAILRARQFPNPAKCRIARRWSVMRIGKPLRSHDGNWTASSRLPLIPSLESVRKYSFPHTPLGAALFRVREGPFLAPISNPGLSPNSQTPRLCSASIRFL